MKRWLYLISAVLAFTAANSYGLSTTLDDQRDVAVTIYNNDLGLVKDTRKLHLPEGVSELKFMDVASRIRPTTVHIKALGEDPGFVVLEQNYEYDLLSPSKLMEKYVGKAIKLLHKSEYTGEEELVDAKLLSINNGPIYMIENEIYLEYPGMVILPEIPENLIAKPTLVWLIQNPGAQEYTTEVSYLTSGIQWKADYVMVLEKNDKTCDLAGWVTIDNRSGATFREALIKLIAGDVHKVETFDYERMAVGRAPMLAEEAFVEEAFFEYHIYTLQRRSTIKENQTKQISLLEAAAIPVKKELLLEGASYYFTSRYGSGIPREKLGVFIEIKNSTDNNLGMPLPKGIIRVYKEDKEGSLQFIGEDSIDHTPKDENVRIKLGEAFDVVGERKQMEWNKIRRNLYESSWEITLRNHKEEAVDVGIIEPMPGDWEVTQKSHKYTKVDAHTIRFDVTVPKDGEVTVTYTVRVTY